MYRPALALGGRGGGLCHVLLSQPHLFCSSPSSVLHLAHIPWLSRPNSLLTRELYPVPILKIGHTKWVRVEAASAMPKKRNIDW